MKLSPREVYKRTIAEAEEFGRQDGQGVIPEFNLLLNKEWQSFTGVSVVWNANYLTTAPGSARLLILRINPETGYSVPVNSDHRLRWEAL